MTSRSAFGQAMLTYPRRVFSSRAVFVFVLVCFPVWGLLLYFPLSRGHLTFLDYVGPIMLLILLMGHMLEQFADSRARLMPGFTAAHSLAGVVLCAAISVIAVVILMIRHGLWTPQPFFWMLIGMAAIPWIVGNPLARAYIFFLFIVSSNTSHPQTVVMEWVETHPYHPVIIVAWIAAAVALVAGWRRIVTLNEERFEYRFVVRDSGSGPRNRRWNQNIGEPHAWIWRWQDRIRDRLLKRLIDTPADTFWKRVNRWQLSSALPLIHTSLFLGGFGLLLGLFALWSCDALTEGSGGYLVSMLLIPVMQFSAFIPFMIWMGQSLNRWRYIDREFLLPVNKDDFFKEAGAGTAVPLPPMMLGAMAGFLLPLAIIRPPFLGAFFVVDLAAACSVILATQILGYGLFVWSALHRSPGLTTMVLAVAFVMMLVTPMSLMAFQPSITTIFWFDAALVLAGLAITRDAYHRWLETELG